MSSEFKDTFEYGARKAHTHNWHTRQPLSLDSIEKYVELAQEMTPHLDAYTSFLKDRLDLDIHIMPASVKARESASRKLADASMNFNPARMQDYLRTTVVAPDTGKMSIKHLSRLIDFIKNDPNTIGYKDEFAAPDESTGYRSFKAHVLIHRPDNPEQQISAEIIIQHKGMLEANLETAALRTMERRFKEMISFKNQNGSTRESIAFASLRFARKVIHDIAAEKAGLNSLVDPTINYHQDLETEATLVNKMQGAYKGVQAKALEAVYRVLH